MMLREGRRGLLKPSEYRHWPNRHITFIVAKKSLIYIFYSIYGICGGKVLVEKSNGAEGLAENVKIPPYGLWGRGLKLLKKPSYDI